MLLLKRTKHDHLLSYIDAIYIHKVEKPILGKSKINITKRILNDGIQGLGSNRNIYYEINPDYAKSQELINLCNSSNYLNENYKSDSCLLTMIIDTYYNSFQKKRGGYRIYKDTITYEYLCDLFDIELKDENIGCTIEQASIFFKKFSLGFVVYDIYMNVVYEYKPNKINQDILRF